MIGSREDVSGRVKRGHGAIFIGGITSEQAKDWVRWRSAPEVFPRGRARPGHLRLSPSPAEDVGGRVRPGRGVTPSEA